MMIRKNKIISAKQLGKTDTKEIFLTLNPPAKKENPGARAGVCGR